MPQIKLEDFSAGWVPSDDAVNGRKNGLLRMTGLDLEQNGVVRMTGGTEALSGAYAAAAHTLFSTYLGGQKFRYLALQNGYIYRDSTAIITTGAFAQAAFGKSYDQVLIFAGQTRVQDDGSSNGITTFPEDIAIPSPPGAVLPFSTIATTDFDGDYEWKIVYINRRGSSIRRSKASPVSSTLTLTPADGVILTVENPWVLHGYTQVDEVWIYRRGGALSQFYKTQEIPSSSFGGGNYFNVTDNFSDSFVLDRGETLDEFVTTVSYADTPDEILEVIGPIGARHFYFTATSCLITERNSPSTYSVKNIINITTANGEAFLFAKQVGENTIAIATTENIYTLTGTFNDLPDGIIDVYFRATNVSEKPIARDACIYGSALIYLSQAGWQLLNIDSGTFESLCAPNTDRLYNGEECHGNLPALIYAGGAFRYPCAVSNGRLYVLMLEQNTLTYRLECYDFSRKYWRTFLYGLSLNRLLAEADGTLVGFGTADRKLRKLDSKSVKAVESILQFISMLTPFYDGGTPRNRKEIQSLKITLKTGGENATITLYTDNNTTAYTRQWTISSADIKEFDLYIGELTFKNFQLKIEGAMSDFVFTNFTATYQELPEAVSYLKIKPTNFGAPARKRIHNFPIVIDTLGNEITVLVNGDLGTPIASQAVTTAQKQTVNIYPSGFTPSVDFEMLIQSPSTDKPFEFYELLQTKFIEIFPEQLVRYLSPTFNFGSFGEKAIVVWPVTIDTLGTDVSFEAIIGQLSYPASGPIVFNHNYKKTINFVFNPVIKGVDIGFKLLGGTFELWEVGKPEIVRTYPVDRTFDVISGVELARFTKIKKIEIRHIGGGATAIPVEFFFEGASSYQTSFTPLPFIETVSTIILPKTVSGRILEIRIGPAAQAFKRIATRIQHATSDMDTELKWAEI